MNNETCKIANKFFENVRQCAYMSYILHQIHTNEISYEEKRGLIKPCFNDLITMRVLYEYEVVENHKNSRWYVYCLQYYYTASIFHTLRHCNCSINIHILVFLGTHFHLIIYSNHIRWFYIALHYAIFFLMLYRMM